MSPGAGHADRGSDRLERGSAIVAVPVQVADEQTLVTVRAILEHSGAGVRVYVFGAAATLESLHSELGQLGEALVSVDFPGSSEVAALNALLAQSASADVALVCPGVRVAAGWLELLAAAALSDSTIATATPVSVGAGGVDVLDEPTISAIVHGGAATAPDADPGTRAGVDRIERGVELEIGAQRAAGVEKLRPRIVTAGPGCVYLRRTALELTGALDPGLTLPDALQALASKAISLGMVNVAAADVLVGGSIALAPAAERAGPGREVVARTGESETLSDAESTIARTLAQDERGPLRRAVDGARLALRRLSVTIDGRSLTAAKLGGTQTYVAELIVALARDTSASVRVLTPPDLAPVAAEAFAALPIELLPYERAVQGCVRSDVVHRPQQVFTPEDLALLRLLGERIVVGQQDLIAYHNPTYHPDLDTWRAHRRTTRLALANADQIVFFSEHARRDALAEDLIEPDRSHVVGIGCDPIEPTGGEVPALGGVVAPGRPFLLCLGADYAHKNRPFAIELLAALRDRGWEGSLVLAGAHVPYGSSREREQQLLRERPELGEVVVDLGPVDELRKQSLYGSARALLYPTVYEGFGLIPLEAARAGLPCLFAQQASLAELAGPAATLVAWDAGASAEAVLPLLRDDEARRRHLHALSATRAPSWDETARRLLNVYERALRARPSVAAPRGWLELEREQYVTRMAAEIEELKQLAQDYQDAYHQLSGRVEHGLPLIDEGGLLSAAQQRGLMRIAGRPGLAALALAPFGALGRLGGRDSSDSAGADH